MGIRSHICGVVLRVSGNPGGALYRMINPALTAWPADLGADLLGHITATHSICTAEAPGPCNPDIDPSYAANTSSRPSICQLTSWYIAGLFRGFIFLTGAKTVLGILALKNSSQNSFFSSPNLNSPNPGLCVRLNDLLSAETVSLNAHSLCLEFYCFFFL